MPPPAPPPGRVWVVPKTGGEPVSVPHEQLQAAIASDRYVLASDEQVMQGQHAADAAANPVSSFVEGAADTLTLGGSSYVDRNVIGFDADELQGIKAQQDSTAGQAGSVAGLGLGIVGGSGLAKGALSALKYTPIAAAQRGAAALGTVAQRAAAARGLGTVAPRVLGLGVEGGVEGAALGFADAVSEASLGDEDIAAEKILASVKENAMLGAGFGAVAGGVLGTGALAGRAVKSGARAVGEAAGALKSKADELTGGIVPQSLNDSAAKIQATLSGGDEAFIRKAGITSLGKEADEVRRAAISKPENIERYTREIRAAADQMQEAGVTIRKVFAGDLKADSVARTVKRSPDTIAAAQKFAQDFQDQVRATITANRRGFGKADVQELNDLADMLVDGAPKGFRKSGKFSQAREEDWFLALDKTRRDLFSWTESAAKSAQMGSSPATRRTLQATSERLRELAEGTRLFLQDESVWGGAAAAQARRNAAGSKFFGTVSDFDRHVFTRSGEPVSPEEFWVKKRPADPQKISNYLKRMNNVEADLSNEQIIGSLKARREMLDTIIDNGDVVGDDLAQLKAARDATIRTEGLLKEASEKIGYADALEAQIAAEGEGAGGMIGGMMGGLMGGPLGAMAGAALGMASKPGATIKRMAVMQSLGERVGGTEMRLHAGVKKFLNAATKRFEELPSRSPKALPPRGGSTKGGKVAAAVGAENILGRSPEAQRTRYTQRVKRIRELVSDPESSIAQIHESILKGVAEPAPRLSMELASQHRRAVEFLNSKIPLEESADTIGFQAHLTQDSVTQRDIDRFARYLRAVDDPVSLMDDLAGRNLSVEAIEAVKTVYPKLFEEMRLRVMTELSKTTKRIAHGDVIELSVLFEFPGHPTLVAEFVARQQERLAQTQPQPEAPAGPAAPPNQTITADLAKNHETHAAQVALRL